MNYEDMEIQEYYEDKNKRNEESVKCWCWAAVIIFGIVVWCFAVKGCVAFFEGK
jgi:hypothetical protein